MSPRRMTALAADKDYEVFREQGWTDEMLVSQGYMVNPDTVRLEWLLPVLSGEPSDAVGNARTLAMGASLMLGKTGRDAIDFAMEGSP